MVDAIFVISNHYFNFILSFGYFSFKKNAKNLTRFGLFDVGKMRKNISKRK